MKYEKLIEKILLGRSDANIDFGDLCGALRKLRFTERIKGSHHMFYKVGVDEIINLQPKGSSAKPYQVRQVRNIILKYSLQIDEE